MAARSKLHGILRVNAQDLGQLFGLDAPVTADAGDPEAREVLPGEVAPTAEVVDPVRVMDDAEEDFGVADVEPVQRSEERVVRPPHDRHVHVVEPPPDPPMAMSTISQAMSHWMTSSSAGTASRIFVISRRMLSR
jgi:hypothetical protein